MEVKPEVRPERLLIEREREKTEEPENPFTRVDIRLECVVEIPREVWRILKPEVSLK